MTGNDLSNRQAPTIGIKVENNLVRYNDTSLKDKLLNTIKGKEKRATFDPIIKNVMEYIFRHTDMKVNLIMDIKNKDNKELIQRIDELPYGEIIYIRKPVEIAIHLNSGDLQYYSDNNSYNRGLVNHKYCMNIHDLNTLLRGC